MALRRYLTNPFATASRNSRKKALEIGADHEFKLETGSTDPEIAAMKAVYEPVYLDTKAMMIQHKIAKSDAVTITRVVEDLFDQLASTKVNYWRFELRKLYPLEAPLTLELFPRGNEPFNTGERQSRLDELETLRIKSMLHPDIQAITTNIDDFNTLINAQYHSQKLKQEKLRFSSDEMDHQKDLLNEATYGNLGLLINKFKSDPSQIERFFDPDLLERAPAKAEDFSGRINGEETKNILVETFTERSELLLINTGEADLNFCLAPDETTSCHDCGIILHKDESRVVLASGLGSLSNTYLNVTNLYTEAEGEYSVSIII